MILKLGMQHRGLEVYKVYINNDPGLTLTYFKARSNSVAYVFEWDTLLQLSYTPGFYAEGYIVFVFPFVRLYVRSFILPSRL